MAIARRWLLAICPVALLAGLTSLPSAAQPAASPAAPAPTASAAPAQAAPQQAYTLPPDKLARSIALSRIRNILNLAGSIWGIVFLWLLLAFRAWYGIEKWAQRISSRRWVQGLVFFVAYLVITALAGAVIDAISNHYERAYGISVQGWGSWLGDQAIALALRLLFFVPVLLLFNWIVRRWRRYWLGIWVVTLPILVFFLLIYPLLVPLFYQQEPLQKNHAALVAKIDAVVARTGIDIPPSRMYLIKASAKSTGINAFVAGIGPTKRYVMWDTATDQMPDDQVLFVFGHESGHYVLHHIPKELAGDAAGLFFVYWACAGFAAWLVKRYGARWGATDLASRTGFVVLLFAISIAGFLTQPAGSAFSRHFEHQADVYGQEAIHGIVPDPQKTAVAAFNKLGESWLEDPNPNPLIEFWLYDHPSVQYRAEFAEHYDPWANGGHGEFFKQ
jgi:Zn-dependent protease with chaperone function